MPRIANILSHANKRSGADILFPVDNPAIMSSMRNANQRRNHRERGQPLEREVKLGILEKHKVRRSVSSSWCSLDNTGYRIIHLEAKITMKTRKDSKSLGKRWPSGILTNSTMEC